MKRRVIAAILSLAMIVTAVPVYAEENSGIVQEITAGEDAALIVTETQEDDAAETFADDIQDAADVSLADGAVTVVSQEEVPEPVGNTMDTADTATDDSVNIMADQPMAIAIAQADIKKISVKVTGDLGQNVFPAGTFTETESTLTQQAGNTEITFNPANAGKDQKLPEVVVAYDTAATLKPGQDYTVAGTNLKNAAKADSVNAPYLTIKFYGDYENLGDIVIKFGITPASLENAAVNFDGKPASGNWTLSYDGKEHVPANISVTLGKGADQAVLSENVDYEVEYAEGYPNKKDAGNYSFKIKGINNYTGKSAAVTYTIEKANAKGNIGQTDLEGRVFYDVADERLNFDTVEAAIAEGVKNTLDSSDILAKGTDYEIVYYKTDGSAAAGDEDKKEAGIHKYEVKVTDKCKNFKEGVGATGTYEIKKEWPLEKVIELRKKAIVEAVSNVSYTGTSLKEELIKKITEALEEYSSDSKGRFKVEYNGGDIVDRGIYTFTVSGAAGSPWASDQPVEISNVQVMPKEMAESATALKSGFTINVTQKYYADGSADAPKLTLKDGGKELKEGTDYTCDPGYDESKRNVVTTAKIKGQGNYRTTVNGAAGEVELALPETRKVIDLNDNTIKAEVTADFNYNPEELTLKAEDITVTQEIPGREEPYRIDPSNYYISETDYGTEDGQSKKAGLHHVTIVAKQNTNYTGKIENIEFTVEGIDINRHYELDTSELDKLQIEFGSEVSCPTPTVVAKGTDKLLNTENYKLSYYKMNGTEKVYVKNAEGSTLFTVDDRITFSEPGSYKIEVIPDSEKFEMYMGTLDCTIEVLSKSIKSEEKFAIKCTEAITWPGRLVTEADLTVTLKEGEKVLKQGTDFTVRLANGDKTGETTVTITGIGNYRESRTVKLTIKQQSLTEATVKYAKDIIPYYTDITKALDDKDVTVKLNEKEVDPAEYIVSCVRDANDSGKAIITVTAAPDGHYIGFAMEKVFAEKGADITDSKRFELQGFEPVLYFYKGDEEVKQEKLVLKDKTLGMELKADSEYQVIYENAAPKSGSVIVIATMTIKGTGDEAGTGYYGTIVKDYTITLPSLGIVTVTAGQDLAYTGAPILPKVTVTDVAGDPVPEDAYDVSGENNQNAGTATVVVTAKENSGYTGFAKTTFVITKAENKVTASISPEMIKIGETAKIAASASGGATFTYTSSDMAIASAAEDGTVTGKAAGTAEITVSAAQTDNYKAASATVTVKVMKPQPQTEAKLPVKGTNTIKADDVKKNYSAKKRSFRLKATAEHNAPLTYVSNKSAVRVDSTGKVTVKAGFFGSANITITAAETDLYQAAVKTIQIVVRPKGTKLKKAVSSGGIIKLKWNKSPNATGYQIQYAKNKSYSGGKIITVKGADGVEKKLEKGKTYYIRIRAYKTISKKRYYSKWSKGQSIKIK